MQSDTGEKAKYSHLKLKMNIAAHSWVQKGNAVRMNDALAYPGNSKQYKASKKITKDWGKFS